MLDPTESWSLAPDVTVSVQWSARVTDFVQDWEHQLCLAEEAPVKDLAHTAHAATSVLWSIEHGLPYVVQALTNLYQVSGQLPAFGDILLVEVLELRVDERRIAVSHIEGIQQVTIAYSFGVERYRYEASPITSVSQPLSSSFFL